jgi:hypothetical protein
MRDPCASKSCVCLGSLRALLGSKLLCKADGSTVSVEDLAGKVVGT